MYVRNFNRPRLLYIDTNTNAIASLKGKLYERQIDSRSLSPNQHNSNYQLSHRPSGSTHKSLDLSNVGITLPHASLVNMMSTENPETSYRSKSRSPELLNIGRRPSSDPFMDLLFSGWNPDLPDPATLSH